MKTIAFIILILTSTIAVSSDLNPYLKELTCVANWDQCTDPSGEPANVVINHADLNLDGIDEIFLLVSGSEQWYGESKGHLQILKVGKNLELESLLSISASNYQILDNVTNGYLDLEFKGPSASQSSIWQFSQEGYRL